MSASTCVLRRRLGTIGAVTVVAKIENRCGRRDKSGFHPNLNSQRAGQITLHDSAQSSPKPKS